MLCGHHPHHKDNICASCWADLPWGHLGFQYQLNDEIQTLSAFDYLPPIKGLIRQFKHQHQLAAGRLLTSCLVHSIQQTMANDCLVKPQLLVPIPLHRARLKQRGFNQAEIIAIGLSNALGIPMHNQLCQRQGSQIAQQGLTRKQRLAQMHGVFSFDHEQLTLGINRIALIDDVITTGATAQAMCSCLQKAWAGPLHIQLWCLARTPAPQAQLPW